MTSSSIENTEEARKLARLSTVEGYFERFFELCSEYPSYYKTYTALEHEYYQVFGNYRYSSYPSFKSSKYRYLKNLQELNKK